MKKLFLLMVVFAFASPALAKKDIVLEYSSENNTRYDQNRTTVGISGKASSYKGSNLRFGVSNENFSDNSGNFSDSPEKYDITILTASLDMEEDGFFWNFVIGYIATDYGSGATEEKLSGRVLGFDAAKDIEGKYLNVKPEFNYRQRSYNTNDLFSTLKYSEKQFGADFYGNIKSIIQLGIYTGVRKDKETRTKEETTTTVESNWYGITRPYIKFNVYDKAEITIAYEQFKYKDGGKSKTATINLGYDF